MGLGLVWNRALRARASARLMCAEVAILFSPTRGGVGRNGRPGQAAGDPATGNPGSGATHGVTTSPLSPPDSDCRPRNPPGPASPGDLLAWLPRSHPHSHILPF